MVVHCASCGHLYDDANCWTLCPHGPLWAPVDAYCAQHDLVDCVVCATRRKVKTTVWRRFRWFCCRYLRLRWHSQNLNERKDGTCGPMWRHGRAWFTIFAQTDEEAERNYKQRPCIGVSWTIPTHFCHIEVERGGYDDYDLSFSIGCGLFALWFHFEHFIPKRWHKWWDPYKPSSLKLAIHNGSIWWNVWVNDNEWSNKTPKWRQGSFCPADFLLGREKYTKRVLREPVAVKIPMPEGVYDGTVSVEEAQWKRPRWPMAKVRVSCDIQVPNPPRFAGKGENDWDCDDDGIFATGCAGDNAEDAVGHYVAQVLKYRKRYGEPAESRA